MSAEALSALASFYKGILTLNAIDGVDRSDYMTETLMILVLSGTIFWNT